MKTILNRILEANPRCKIEFVTKSGNRLTYDTYNGKFDVRYHPRFISFTNNNETYVIEVESIESLKFEKQ